jgi:hypothetical protein
MWKYLMTNPEVAVAAAAVFSSFTAVVALAVSTIALVIQRKHNRLSVRPIAYFVFGNYEDDLYVKLKNYGSGPLCVEKLIVLSTKGAENETLIDAVSHALPKITWRDFVESIVGRTIPSGEEIVLLRYCPQEDNQEDLEARSTLREILSAMTLLVEYSDIYDKRQPPTQRSLDFFSLG